MARFAFGGAGNGAQYIQDPYGVLGSVHLEPIAIGLGCEYASRSRSRLSLFSTREGGWVFFQLLRLDGELLRLPR